MKIKATLSLEDLAKMIESTYGMTVSIEEIEITKGGLEFSLGSNKLLEPKVKSEPTKVAPKKKEVKKEAETEETEEAPFDVEEEATETAPSLFSKEAKKEDSAEEKKTSTKSLFGDVKGRN